MANPRINPYDSTTVTGTSTGMVRGGANDSRKKNKFRVEKPKRSKPGDKKRIQPVPRPVGPPIRKPGPPTVMPSPRPKPTPKPVVDPTADYNRNYRRGPGRPRSGGNQIGFRSKKFPGVM